MSAQRGAGRPGLARGLLVAAALIVADQLLKLWVLALFRDNPRTIEVTSFFDLVLVWNRGISFGLFNRGEGLSPYLFIGLAAAVSLGLILVLPRVKRALLWLAFGLVIGGALGNVIDRLRFGAVVDFLYVHAGRYGWPAFNLADAAITVGAALVLLDALLGKRKRPK